MTVLSQFEECRGGNFFLMSNKIGKLSLDCHQMTPRVEMDLLLKLGFRTCRSTVLDCLSYSRQIQAGHRNNPDLIVECKCFLHVHSIPSIFLSIHLFIHHAFIQLYSSIHPSTHSSIYPQSSLIFISRALQYNMHNHEYIQAE